jgi:flagellar protein FliO/FliZ
VPYQLDALGSLSLAVGLVVALLWAALWVLRRGRPGGFAPKGDDCRILRALSLGPRERLFVVAIGAQQLVIGVTPEAISLLCELTAPLAPSAPASPGFAEAVRKACERWRA